MMVFGKSKEPQNHSNMDTTLVSITFSVNTDGTKGNTDGTNNYPNKIFTITKTMTKRTRRMMWTSSSTTTVLQHTRHPNIVPMTMDGMRNLTFLHSTEPLNLSSLMLHTGLPFYL